MPNKTGGNLRPSKRKKRINILLSLLLLIFAQSLSACSLIKTGESRSTNTTSTITKTDKEDNKTKQSENIISSLPAAEDGVVYPTGAGNIIGFSPDPDRTLSLHLLGKEICLDPFSTQDGFPVNSQKGCDLIYETLLKWDPEKLTYTAGLAELIRVSADGIELRLKDDAVWQDGRPVTAEQIEISLYWQAKFMADLKDAEGLITNVQETSSLRQNKLLLELSQIDEFHQALALDLLCRAPILPTTLWSMGEDPLTMTREELVERAIFMPLGTGEWQVLLNDSFQLVLERQGQVPLDKPRYLLLKKYKDKSSLERALASFEIDCLVGVSSEEADNLLYHPGRPVLAGIKTNLNKPLLNNPNILNLLQLSVDMSKSSKALEIKAAITPYWHYFGGATMVNSLRAGMSNPEFAASFLKKKEDIASRLNARFDSQGILELEDGSSLTLELILPRYDTAANKACSVFAQLARLQGVDIQLVRLSPDVFKERWQKQEYDLAFVQKSLSLDTPYSLAKDFLSQWSAMEMSELELEEDLAGRELVLRLAAADNADKFLAAAKEACQFNLLKMHFYPLGVRTVNNCLLNSNQWNNGASYWSVHLDNRDLAGISAASMLDSISTRKDK